MTLNNKHQIDLNTDIFSGDQCDTFATFEGCFLEEAHLNRFNEQFYSDSSTLIEPEYVTFYAGTNSVEDIAESFAYYITQEDIPEAHESNSGALHKMNFIGDRPELASLKETIRNNVNLGFFDVDREGIYNFNRDRNGNKISCTDHAKIVKAFKTNKE